MSRETLAIDLDDVVLATAEPLLEFYNNAHGATLTLKDYYSNDLHVLQAPDLATAIKRFHVYLDSPEFFKLPPTQEAVEALNILKEHYSLYAVTGRNSVVEEATKLWLEDHLSGLFEDAIFTSYYNAKENASISTKAKVCQEIGAVALIEDHLDHAIQVAQAGIDVLLFGSYPWNQAESLPRNITRVNNWPEITRLLLPDYGEN